MGILDRFRERRQAATGTVRNWAILAVLWAVLTWSGCGWLFPWISPVIRQAPQPPTETEIHTPAETVLTTESGGDRTEYGWAGPQMAATARAELGPQIHAYAYDPAEWAAIEGKRIVLWPYIRAINSAFGDQDNIPQPAGDCVSRGWSHGCEFSLAVWAYFNGGKFTRVYPPYIYGISRVQIGGGRIGGDGSVGAWAAKGVEQYGVLEWTADLPRYEAANIRAWGRNGPPASAIEKGKLHTASTRLVTDWPGLCVAISQGCPVPVCSNQGFQKIVEANGRIEGRASGNWAHCMVLIGCDTRPGLEAAYCLNSWGPNAHAPCEKYKALDGAPCGGFWIPRKTVESMLAAKDSYAVSFDGFARRQSAVLKAFGQPSRN